MSLNLFNPFKILFAVWAVLSIFIIPYMSRNASVTEDEFQHRDHGHRLLAWYETHGRDTGAVASPFDGKDRWKVEDTKTAINIYGGFFDLTCTFFYQHFFHNVIGEFEFRHIMSSLFGAVMLIFTGLICFSLTDSWAIALLGLIIASFTPRIIGNSLSNPKDIPMATFFAFSLWQIVSFLRWLPRVRIWQAALLILSFMLALAVRSGAIILLVYFIMFTAIYVGYMLYDSQLTMNRTLRIGALCTGICIAGYFGSLLLWPWGMQNPLVNPFKSLAVFKNFDAFHSLGLFEGKWLEGNHIPWYFVPKWLYITLPVSVTGGLILFCVLLPGFIRSSWFSKVGTTLIVFSIVFPIASIIINKSNIYDGARHILFVVPSIIVLATMGWAKLFDSIHAPYLKLTTGLLLFFILLEPAMFIFRNNPVQAMYFSPLIGGTKGAFKNYEMDYYGYSVKPAIDWIEQNDTMYKSGHKARVRLWYGEQGKLSYYIDSSRSEHLQYALAQENSTDWDYYIEMPAEAKFNPDIIYHWPPKGTIYEVTADSAPLCAVIKNWRVQEAPPAFNAASGGMVDSSVGYINMGMAYYKAGDYNKAVVAFKNAVAANTQNALAYNDVAACYNQLHMFDDAIVYAEKGLSISPDFELLRNNLKSTLQAKQNWTYNENYYLGLSYNYYQQRDFESSIKAAKMILKYNPNNSAAWNNICSAYNEMGQYQKAMEACREGLKLNANDKLLQGNLNESLKALKK